MEWESEERILVPKSNKNQNSSASVGPGNTLRSSLSNSEMKEQEAGNRVQKSGAGLNTPAFASVSATSSPAGKEGKQIEKVNWEPPCKRTIYQE